MGVRAHAAMHHVKMRQFAGGQTKELLDVVDIACRSVGRV